MLVVVLGVSANSYPTYATGIDEISTIQDSENISNDDTDVIVDGIGNDELETVKVNIDSNNTSDDDINIIVDNMGNDELGPDTGAATLMSNYGITNNGGFTVIGGTYGVDYEFDSAGDGTLRILSATELHITTGGAPTRSSIRCEVDIRSSYNLVFEDVNIDTESNNPGLFCDSFLNLTIHGNSIIQSDETGFVSDAAIWARGMLVKITEQSTGLLTVNTRDATALAIEILVGGGALYYGGNFGVMAGAVNVQRQGNPDLDAIGVSSILWTSGTGTVNNEVFEKPKASVPNIRSSTVDVSSLWVAVRLPQADVVNNSGGLHFSIDEVTWQTNPTFSNLKADTEYTVYAKNFGGNGYADSDSAVRIVRTLPAVYEVSIPATTAVGAEPVDIKLREGATLNLGYDGQVNVKVTGGITDGLLTLERIGETNTITSKLLVNGSPFENTNENVATFTVDNREPVPIAFSPPTQADISAGTYTGTVTFDISYSQ